MNKYQVSAQTNSGEIYPTEATGKRYETIHAPKFTDACDALLALTGANGITDLKKMVIIKVGKNA